MALVGIGVIPGNAERLQQCLQLLEDFIFAFTKDSGQYDAGHMISRILQPTLLEFLADRGTLFVPFRFHSKLPT